MGLLPQMARLIVREHRAQPITGSLLLIGRQTVPLTWDQASQLVRSEGIQPRLHAKLEYDSVTRGASNQRFISDRSFFSLFSEADVKALDVSGYEGAEIVCNLNEPIKEELAGRFDFIYNGSVLDNVFDPATSIKNMTRLLKPGGRIAHLEHGSHVNGPYLMFPVEWFYDYYLANGFDDCRVYAAFFSRVGGPWDLYRWDPISNAGSQVFTEWAVRYPQRRQVFIVAIATIGAASTWDRSPIQSQYRSAAEAMEYDEAAKRLTSSSRIDANRSSEITLHSLYGASYQALRFAKRLLKSRILRRGKSYPFRSAFTFSGRIR